VANRKISQFPTIESVDIANADLLTLVHVFEVDPALRNKKISFSGFRSYLDQYYINVGEDPTYNNVTITGNLGVSGDTSLNTLSVSGASDFQAVLIGGDLSVSGSFSVTGTITGSQIEVDNVVADFIEISSGNFTMITGTTIDFVTGYFDTMSGATLTGESFGVVSGIIVDADINDLYAQVAQIDTLSNNNATFTGILTHSGTINANDINATGTISGATITGDIGQYTTLTGQTAVFTTQVFGTNITGDSAYFERTTGTFIDVTNLSGTTITGDYGQFLNLTGFSSHATSFSGTTITGDTASLAVTLGTSGFFTYLSGITVTGASGLFTNVQAQTLTAANLQFSGDQTVSGSFTVLEDLFVGGSGYFASGITVTGEVSGEIITAQSGNFDTIITAPLITGTVSGDNVYVSGTITGTTISTTSGHFVTATGTSAEFTTFNGASGVFTNVTGTSFSGTTIHAQTGVFASGTALRPSISFEGQDDTGIFVTSGVIDGNPAEEKYLGFTTSGQERFRISRYGALGISGENYGAHGQVLVSQGAGEAPTWTSTISGIVISGGEITITGDLFVSNTITGYRISGEFIDAVQEITAASGAFAGTVTGLTVLATTLSGATVSGQTVTGTRALFTTGTFQDLFVDDDFVIGDNLTVSGDLEVSGNSVFDSGIVVSGSSVFREGITVTGTSNFVSGILIGQNLTVTGTISGTTVTGETALFTTGQFNDLYIDDVFIVGDNLTVSGDLNVSGEAYFESGLTSRDQAFFPSGSQANPGIAFIDDANTGLYTSSGDAIEFTAGATRKATISSGTYGAVLTIWGN
jgi:cytoskeletal protein CcmA (bactofilin family)|tara:strand:+ start:65057 stop:67489 length:2433 start_codon:yes stop_codon:yes gene_type:complete